MQDSLFDTARVAVPVVLGALVWAAQTLAQRAWTEYEHRRAIYADVIKLIDALFEGGDVHDRREYLRTIRQVWLVGSDRVVLAANALSAAIREGRSDQLEHLYSEFIASMRKDLRSRRWLPPGTTALNQASFPVEGPGGH